MFNDFIIIQLLTNNWTYALLLVSVIHPLYFSAAVYCKQKRQNINKRLTRSSRRCCVVQQYLKFSSKTERVFMYITYLLVIQRGDL